LVADDVVNVQYGLFPLQMTGRIAGDPLACNSQTGSTLLGGVVLINAAEQAIGQTATPI